VGSAPIGESRPDLLFTYASEAESAASKSSSPEQAALRICLE